MSKGLTTTAIVFFVATVLCSFILATRSFAGSEESPLSNSTSENVALPDPLQAGWNGSPVCENLFEDEQQRILRCTFPPGGGHDRHYHRPHVGYALSGGKVRMIDANGVREIELPTDSSYSSDGVVWHEILNIGTTTIRYLIVEQK